MFPSVSHIANALHSRSYIATEVVQSSNCELLIGPYRHLKFLIVTLRGKHRAHPLLRCNDKHTVTLKTLARISNIVKIILKIYYPYIVIHIFKNVKF